MSAQDSLPSDRLVKRASESPGGATVEILASDLAALLECVEALRLTSAMIPMGCPCPECAARQRGLAALKKLEAEYNDEFYLYEENPPVRREDIT